MWIMFRTKPPCENAPPKLSIFWSVPWPKEWALKEIPLKVSFTKVNKAVADAAWDEWITTPEGSEWAKAFGKPPFAELKKKLPHFLLEKYLVELVYKDDVKWGKGGAAFKGWGHPFGGLDHDWAKARAIIHDGEKVRVFPDEFAPVSPETMHRYISEGTHELVPGDAAEQKIVGEIETGLQRVLYEEALVAGCDHAQALLTAMGQDPTEGMEFPPIGWYKCHPAYKSYFCYWHELEPEDQEWLEANPQEPIQLFTLMKEPKLKKAKKKKSKKTGKGKP